MITITIGKKFMALAAAAAAATAASVAVAAWSTGGSGNGAAKAATAAALTLGDSTAIAAADLYPGASGDLKLRVSNPNGFPVRVTSVALQSGGTITSSSSACNTAGHGVSFANQSGLSLDLAANASNTEFTLDNVVSMLGSSGNACQGVTFTVPVDVVATTT